MIKSRFPPSRLFGSVATTVSCPAFTCFVSTSRRLFVTAQWETAVFEVSPRNDFVLRLRVSFGYPCKLKQKGSAILHDMFCSKLNDNGEATHNGLHECVSAVLKELAENNVIGWVTLHEKGEF